MKSLFAVCMLLSAFFFTSPTLTAQSNPKLTGAWSLEQDNITHLLLFTNQHFSYTVYNIPQKKFIHTHGGSWKETGNSISTIIEFHTADKSLVGKPGVYSVKLQDKTLTSNWSGQEKTWKQLDNGGGELNATWRITGRDQNGQMNNIPASARKTIKIMTGTRFQWAAINTGTGEFFGTGGGTYTFKDGRYTEFIEFFSRDSSRVGMQLSFEGKVEGKDWHHRGKSSKGDPIYEIWSKED